MYKLINATSEKQLLIGLIFFGIISRLLLLVIYSGYTIVGDSNDYIVLAKQIAALSLDNYEGRRTPAYSLIIALLNNNLALVVLFQLILGVLNIGLIFKFISSLTNKNIALYSAFSYSLFTHILFYEFTILTESLTTSLLIISIWYLCKNDLFNPLSKLKHYIIFSLILGLLYLTKPMFIYISLGFLCFYILKNWKVKNKFHYLKPLLTFSICVFIYLGWNLFNKKHIGYFTNTQYFGIYLTQTTTPFFDKVPKKNKLIRDIIVKQRDSILLKMPKAEAMTVWFAYKELKEKTHLTDVVLANKLGLISKQLITNHPLTYTKQVFKYWLLFWGKPHIYWNKTNFKSPYFNYANNFLWFNIIRYIVVLFNFLFLIFFIKTLISFITQRKIIYDTTFFISTVIIVGSIVQALVIYGSNSRFCVPFFSLIIYVVVLNIFKFTTSKSKS